MEYVGMASVFTVILLAIFAPLGAWTPRLFATAGMFFLFVGIKKKTRDHLSASFLLFAVAAVASAPLRDAGWAVPFALFTASLAALEGYLEKRQEQIFALPVLFFFWGRLDATPLLGLVFAALYLLLPWSERPALRPRLLALWATSVVAALAGAWIRIGGPSTEALLPRTYLAPTRPELLWFALLGVPALAATLAYWRRLKAPHRWAPLVFLALAPFDERALAAAAAVSAVVLSATILRLSIDSDRWRPLFKHAEWHFFWWVLAAALWAIAA